MYVQAIVTEALAEGYGITGSPDLRYPMERAADFIIRAQNVPKRNPTDEGGWRYTPTSADSDLSVSSWQIMALKLGKQAGQRAPRALIEKAVEMNWGLSAANKMTRVTKPPGERGPKEVFMVPEEVFTKAREYVWNTYGENGFGYGGPGFTPNMTAVGIFCSYLLGCGDDPRIGNALEALRTNLNPSGWYGWYFMTQACFQGGESCWSQWNVKVKEVVLPEQASDGHWPCVVENAIARQARQPAIANWLDAAATGDSPVYSTAMATMILEAYYRYPRISRTPRKE